MNLNIQGKMSKKSDKDKAVLKKPIIDLMAKAKVEPICNNCLLYNREKGECRVAVFINNVRFHMPVFPGDHCHMDDLGIKVEQVRWWTEDKSGNQTDGNGKVKIEYPEGFFKALDPDDFLDIGNKEVPPLPIGDN